MAAEVVSFAGEGRTLHGVLFKPEGDGPFPAMLYNHGAAEGMLSSQAFDQIGPRFVDHGWVFFAPYRRGQGLSADAGPYIMDAVSAAQSQGTRDAAPLVLGVTVLLVAVLLFLMRRRRWWLRTVPLVMLCFLAMGAFSLIGTQARAEAAVHLLETDHLNDHLAAFEWLRTQGFVQGDRIATGGNSYGGMVTVLGAERVAYCAAVDGSGGAQSWDAMRPLRQRMVRAVRNARAPIFFFQAANDYSIAPTRVLSAEMQRAGKPFELKIFPAYGSSPDDGHSFAWGGSAVWAPDVFRFLDAHCE
jgi:carboxymethylenebutenolidase